MVDDKKPKIPPPPLPGQKPPARPPVPGAIKPPLPAPSLKPGAASAGAVAQPASDVDAIRQQMETQIGTLQRQLQNEREKMLMQSVRAKEEEVMAAKVEESLKDIQDRLRREKREQELQETLAKTENQVRELEQRLQTERQTWVETLKTQLSQRETQDRDLENNFRMQLKELERRWHEEKLAWSQALKRKDEEISRLKKDMETAVASERDAAEKRLAQLEGERESLKRELKDTGEVRQEERTNLLAKLENRDKEYLGIKAQQAMIVTQLRQEKEKAEQLRTLLERMKAERTALAARSEGKEKEFFLFKTQFAMYQTRSKSEQEKLLKEMVLFKDQIQKERQQFEVALKAKEHEIGFLQQNALGKENDLKAVVEKKEQEINALVRQYEERVKARENELRYLFEKKETEYQVLLKQQEDKLAQKEQGFLQMIGRKDSELAALQAQWGEKLGSKEKELALLLDKERDYKVSLAQQAQQLFELREKVNARAAEILQERDNAARRERELNDLISKKDTILEREQLAWHDKLEKKERELGEGADRERALKNTLAQYELQIREFQSRIEAQMREAAVERARFEQKERELLALITARENEMKAVEDQWTEKLAAQTRAMNITLLAKENEIKTRDDQWGEKLAARDHEMHNALLKKDNEIKVRDEQWTAKYAIREKDLAAAAEQEKTLRLSILQHEQKIKELEHALRLGEQDAARSRDIIERKEKELIALAETARAEKILLGEKFAEERARLLAQIEATKEEYRRLMDSREEHVRALELRGKELTGEIDALKTAIDGRDKDTEKLRNEYLLKAKDIEIEAARKEFVFRQETAALQGKIEELNTVLAEKEKAFHRELEGRDQELRKKEAMAVAEHMAHESALAALRDETRELRQEKESILRDREQVVQSVRAQGIEFEQRLRSEREKVEQQLQLKEQELTQIRVGRYTFETELRRELEQKYRADIEQLEDEKAALNREIEQKYRGTIEQFQQEKETAAQNTARKIEQLQQEKDAAVQNAVGEIEQKYQGAIEQFRREKESTAQNVAREIQVIRTSLRGEIQAIEEQFDGERADFRAKLKDRDDALTAMQEKIAEQTRQYAELQNAITEERAAWDKQKELLLKQNNEDKTVIDKLEKRYDDLMTNYEEVEYDLMVRKEDHSQADEATKALQQQNEEQRVALEKLEKRYDDLMTSFEEIEYELMVKNKEIAAVQDGIIIERREPQPSDGPSGFIAQSDASGTVAVPMAAPATRVQNVPVAETTQEANPVTIVYGGASGGLGGYLSRFWNDINKPVIEINMKSKKEMKN